MLSDLSKSSLAVLFACTFFASSGARAIDNAGSSDTFSSASASAYAGAVASVGTLNGASAFTGTGNFPETHEGHKGIRSYDNTDFSHDNDPNRGVKALHREMKSHDKDDCSKCKWENDDYWERDEPEEERDGDECDDGDDGQYKPDKTYHHDGSRSGVHASGLHPSGVYKTGPTGVYGDNVEGGVKGGKSDGPSNFPTINRYAGSTYESTPKPGSSWNTPFVGTSKPGYSGVGSFATTPSYGSGWNRGTTPTSFGSMPASNGGYSSTFAGTTSSTGFGGAPTVAGFPSSQKSGSSWGVNHDNMPAGSYGTTPKPETSFGTSIGGLPAFQKPRIPWSGGHDGNSYGTTPGQGWNTPTSPSSYKPSPNWNANRDNTPAGSFGTTSRPGSSWNTGTSVAGSPSSQKPVAPWNTEHDSASVGSLGATTKSQLDRHTGFNSQSESGWNPSKGTASFGTSGCAQPHLSCNQGKQGPVKVGATPFDSSLAKSNEFPSGISPGASHGGSDTSGAHAGTSVIPSFGSTPHGEIPDFGQKGHPFGFDKTTANIFGPTKSPHGGFSPPGTFSGDHGNRPSPGKIPESPTGGSIYEYSGTAKPGYGSGTTSSWSNAGHTGSGSNDWPGSHAVFPASNAGFGTTKTPFSHVSTPGSSGSPYGGARPKLTGFNVASSNAVAGAVAGANAFGTSFGTYNTPGVTRSPFVDSTPSAHTGSYAGVKGPSGSVIPTYGTGYHGTQPGAWPDKQPGTTPGRQPNGGNPPLPNQQSESDISVSGGHPGSGNWPSRQPGGATTPGGYFESDSGTWPRGRITPSDHRGISPGRHSAGSTWPGGQVGPECTSGSCGRPNGPFSGSNSCGENYNCGRGCGRENNAPTIHGPCGGAISGPSGVNKTYYPAGTGDGSVPNIANTYSPFPNTGSGAYPGFNTGCGDNSCNQGGAGVTPGDSVQWNSANPFLYGSVDGIRNDASRPWSATTPKPIGEGNLFLDSGWSSPKPVSNNANNDRNVIPLGQENSPFNKENPFLNGNKRRGDIPVTTDERVIPLGERKPDGNNPFGAPLDSRDPSYGEHPVRLPGSRIPGSSGYGDVKSGPYPGGVSPQSGNSGAPYPARDIPQDVGPLQCKLGLFGCGTPNSGSYAGGKYPGEVHAGIGGNIGTGSVNSSPGDLKSSGVGNYGGGFNIGAGHPGSIGSNLAGSVGGAHAGAYAGSFSSAQASSSSFANAKSLSFSGTGGHSDNFGQANSGSWSGAQNQAEPNSWASSGASAFASSSAGSWSGNHPVDVKG